MSDSGIRARAMLDAWREQNADRLHPLRFHFIEALERRAATHAGEARRLLEDRLSTLIDAYAADLERAPSHVDATDSAGTSDAPARSALGELIAHFAHPAAARDDELGASNAALQSSSLPTLDVLGEFQKIWSDVRVESQVRQSLDQVPTDAGPLNSASLVHRSLTLMRELSPEYLQQFLAYVDALSGMEQISGASIKTKDGVGGASLKKRARSKPRTKRE